MLLYVQLNVNLSFFDAVYFILSCLFYLVLKYDVNDRNYVLLAKKRKILIPAGLRIFHFLYLHYTLYCHVLVRASRRGLDW